MSLFKKEVVQRQIDPNKPNDFIWRIPNETYSKTSKVSAIMVRDFERAIFLKDGLFQNVLPPGKHAVPKNTGEIIWIDVSPKTKPFGIPVYQGPVTADGFQFGLSGTLTLRIMFTRGDVRNFLLEMVCGQTTFDSEQLVDWLRKGPLVSVLRDIFKKLTIEQYHLLDREEFMNRNVKPRLVEELSKYGVDLVSIDITGMTSPQKI